MNGSPSTPPEGLSDGQELFAFLLANMPDQIYFKDREGRFVRVSRAVAEYLGARTTAEVIGKTDFDFWDEETARAAAADERQVMESGEPIIGKIEKLVYPNGRVAWDYTTKLPFRNSRGEVIGICGINKDFTKVREMEDALREEHRRLQVTTAVLERWNAQIEADLHMAREVQQALMPRQYLAFKDREADAGSALFFSHCYIPAIAVGGDFFHVFPLPENRAGVFICDVMGHGVRAALITAIVRTVLEELRSQVLEPGLFMSGLNKRLRSILARVDEPFLATACLLVVDPANDALEFATAGHPRPARLRTGEDFAEWLDPGRDAVGPGLGLFDEAEYPTVCSTFGSSDRIVLFTDGIHEAENGEGEDFGLEGFLDCLRRHSGDPAQAMLEAVIADIRAFSGRSDFEDDVCILTVGRAGQGRGGGPSG